MHTQHRGSGGGKQAGFTLLEVTICASILVVASMALAAASCAFGQLRRVNEETQTASAAARQQLDIIRGTQFSQISANFGGLNFQVDLDGNGINDLNPQANDPDGMVGGVAVTEVGPASDPSSLLQVDVSLRWTGVQGNRTHQVGTLISNRAGT